MGGAGTLAYYVGNDSRISYMLSIKLFVSWEGLAVHLLEQDAGHLSPSVRFVL